MELEQKVLHLQNFTRDFAAQQAIFTTNVGEIRNGVVTNPNEFPFQVLFLRNSTKVLCGGSILDQHIVLTAAHCLLDDDGYKYEAKEYESWTIVAGDHNWKISEGTEQRRKIHDMKIHEKYKPFIYVNDIAIVELDQPLELKKEVQPIMLPPADYEATGNVVVTGWGKLQYGGKTPAVLQKVVVPIVDRADCVKAFEEEQVFVSIKMMCAGLLGIGGVDSCDGDSGGPLSAQLGNGSSMLVGIVSSGIECARKEYPGIYIQVSKYIDWINKTRNSLDKCALNNVSCPNEGTCRNTTGSYTCNCAQYYSGNHCEIISDCLLNNECKNGATCKSEIDKNSQNSSYTCLCPRGYFGRTCSCSIASIRHSPSGPPQKVITVTECGGLIQVPDLPASSSFLIDYKSNVIDSKKNECFWTLDTTQGFISYLLTVRMTLLCDGFADSQDSLAVLGWNHTFQNDKLFQNILSKQFPVYESNVWGYKLFLHYKTKSKPQSGFILRIDVLEVDNAHPGSNHASKASEGSQTFGPFNRHSLFSMTVTPPKTKFSLTIDYWDSKNVGDCHHYDALYIYSITSLTSYDEIDKLCKSVKSPSSYSSAHPILILYHTLFSTTGRGFSFSWRQA